MPRNLFTKRAYLLVFLIAAAVLFFIYIPSLSKFSRNLSVRIVNVPIGMCKYLDTYFQSKKKLVDENALLKKKADDLSLSISQMEEAKDENERLRGLLEFKKRFGFSTISAEIIIRNPTSWVESFIINKGSKNAIKNNSAVCSAKGLVGKVTETDENTSSVMLLTNPAFKTGGIIRSSRINGIVVGAGEGQVKMLYLPLDADVEKGDIVETSDYSQIFPKGIIIGEIMGVEKSKTGLFKTVLIKPAVDPRVLEEVLIVK